MDHIVNVYQLEENEGEYQFMTTVTSPDGSTHEYAVTLTQPYYVALTGEAISPDELVQFSFEFLLARESPDEILPHFDLSVIETYFPEYESEIRKRASAV